MVIKHQPIEFNPSRPSNLSLHNFKCDKRWITCQNQLCLFLGGTYCGFYKKFLKADFKLKCMRPSVAFSFSWNKLVRSMRFFMDLTVKIKMLSKSTFSKNELGIHEVWAFSLFPIQEIGWFLWIFQIWRITSSCKRWINSFSKIGSSKTARIGNCCRF